MTPLLPRDYDWLEQWFKILHHAKAVITPGVNQWLEIGVFIDADGHPQFWEVGDPRRLSPKDREVKIED